MHRYRIEILADSHSRAAFSSGAATLDTYLHKQVGQDVRRRVATCYVATDPGTKMVAGYYTVAASGVPLADLPETLRKKLPRYPSVPVARLGRLAVDQAHAGQGLGAALLWNAVTRCSRSELAVFALVVDALDERAEAFYRHHGLIPLGSGGRQLMIPLPKAG